MAHRTFAFIRWERLPVALALGWLPCADLGPIHGHWSLLCEWRCACGRDARMPGGAAAPGGLFGDAS